MQAFYLTTGVSNTGCNEAPDALLVQEDGKPVGVLTRQDLLAYIVRS